MHNIHPPWGGISFELEEIPCVHMQPPIHSSHFFVIIWPWPPIPCIDQSTYKMNAFEKYGQTNIGTDTRATFNKSNAF